MKQIYLDYAAATPMRGEVRKAMEPYFSEKFYNPSATYLAAREVRRELAAFRAKIAGHLGARPAEIIFTAGATEANNLAISGVMRAFPEGEVLVSGLEHSSVLETAKQFKHRFIPVSSKGIIELEKLEKMVSPKTVLVSVMQVSNSLGTIQPLHETSQLLNLLSKSRKSPGSLPLFLHSDAVQGPNYLDMHVSRLGVDLLTLNGDKIYGPKHSSVLYVRAGARLQPLFYGGGQELGLRSGTENMPAIAGLATALDLAQSGRADESRRLMDLRSQFVSGLVEACPAAIVNGDPRRMAPHIVSVTFPGFDNERLMIELDEAGIICGIGSACSASDDKPSEALKAIGLSDSQARATLRFSLGRGTTSKQLGKTIELLARLTSVKQ